MEDTLSSSARPDGQKEQAQQDTSEPLITAIGPAAAQDSLADAATDAADKSLADTEATAETYTGDAPAAAAVNETPPPPAEIAPVRDTRAGIRFLATAGAVLFAIYIVRLFHLLEKPVFSRIYYGNLNRVFYAVCALLFWVAFLITLAAFSRKYLDTRLFQRKRKSLPIKKTAIIYGITVVVVFIVSAAFRFELKIVKELGEKVTGMQMVSNVAMYVLSAVQLLLGILLMILVQTGCEKFLPAKWRNFPIPYGPASMLICYGVPELILSASPYALLYLFFIFLYGLIYFLSDRSFFVTYITSLIIFIL